MAELLLLGRGLQGLLLLLLLRAGRALALVLGSRHPALCLHGNPKENEELKAKASPGTHPSP